MLIGPRYPNSLMTGVGESIRNANTFSTPEEGTHIPCWQIGLIIIIMLSRQVTILYVTL